MTWAMCVGLTGDLRRLWRVRQGQRVSQWADKRPVNAVHSTCQVARKKISQASFSDHVELLPAVSWKPPGEEETIDCPDIEATLPDRDLPSSDAWHPLFSPEDA
ncbi:hypothetical protein OPV22_009174 [Ensete ventricosum]|uniref:Uncharacterized protein n=1 Tax=Ensete ventricosum TaxID=4639 RepID=A0AAV8RCR3_ENSVE|nr:hypothetical protein OPV22_009174 [Ensete ventricosum]